MCHDINNKIVKYKYSFYSEKQRIKDLETNKRKEKERKMKEKKKKIERKIQLLIINNLFEQHVIMGNGILPIMNEIKKKEEIMNEIKLKKRRN